VVAPPSAPGFALPSLPAALATGWAVVALLLLAWYAGRRLILVGRLGDRRVVAEGEMPELLASLRREAGSRRRVLLTASQAISSPVALGSGEICLPAAALDDLDAVQQRAMLAHELAHLVRRDPEWLTFACVMERLFFFQPLNRLARRGIQESAEYLADEWAARRSGGVPLARCLVQVAEWIQASPLGVPMAGMAEQRSQLAERVSRLLARGEFGAPRPRHATAMLSVGALVALTLLAPGVHGHRSAGDPALEDYRIPTDAEIGLPGGSIPETTSRPAAGDEQDPDRLDGGNTSFNSNTNDGEVEQSFEIDGEMLSASARDTVVVRALMARLRDEDAEVRQAAAHALGQIENPMAIPALVAALDDPDPDVTQAALSALSSFDRGVPAAPIRRLLSSPDAETRQQAVSILGELRDRESAPAIARLVRDSDADVRQGAISALGDMRDPASSAVIIAAVSDEDPDVRQSALYALQDVGGTPPDALMERVLRDDDSDVREAALQLVEDRQLVSLVPVVIRLLNDPSSNVRECAAEVLAELRTEPARAALRAALTHSDPKVRRVAVEFFGEEGDS
jgi:HEAT repeat protein/beta-lactamase regulating signal transducer with metallopeptidase domain